MNTYIISLINCVAFCVHADVLEFPECFVRFVTDERFVAFLLFDDVLKIEKQVPNYDNSDYDYITIYEKS